MPEPFTTADPVVTEDVTTRTDEQNAQVMLIPDTVTVRDLADVLNQMGATPRDLISILEALQQLGALQMELVTM
jgi:flagellar P-ring protein precursor FlgI